jgi:hypothetical protein
MFAMGDYARCLLYGTMLQHPSKQLGMEVSLYMHHDYSTHYQLISEI